MAKKKLNFEEKYERLQEIVNELDNPNNSLDELLKIFEEGIIISKELKNYLEKAELKIKEIIEGNINNKTED